jgi:hypothetical protein
VSEVPSGQDDPRLGPRRWRVYWVAPVGTDGSQGRTTIRPGTVVAGHHPHRPGPADLVPGPRGAGRGPITRWFLTWEEYEAWKASLPVEDQFFADLYAHVEHTPLDFVPNRCTPCALNQSMYQIATGQGIVVLCRHGIRLYDGDLCPEGCTP